MDIVIGLLVLGAMAFVVWAVIKKACAFGGIAALLLAGAAFVFFVLR